MKKTIVASFGTALAVAALTLTASAQQGGTGLGRGPQGMRPGPQGFPPPPPVFVLLDDNKDGALTPAEVAQLSAKLFALDTNADKSLTPEELMAPCPRPDGQNPPPQRPEGHPGRGKGKGGLGQGPGPDGPCHMFMALFDADRNGTLSEQEIVNSPEVLAALDKNGDEKLTPDELRPRDGRGPRGPGPRPRPETQQQ